MKPDGLIIMGVAGCGKTSIGKALAADLGWDFFDADDFHPPANIAKMASGIPLTDEDRAPWLDALSQQLDATLKAGRHPVLACSALKERYRRQLMAGRRGLRLIYLRGDYGLIETRLKQRSGHYMKPEMLRSQFDALEEPKNALVMDISQSLEAVVSNILQNLEQVPMDIAILGLGVMGRSLALNFERHGYRVGGFDPAPKFPASFFDGKSVQIFDDLPALMSAFPSPRRILLMVPAGSPVDAAIDGLLPHLAAGDIVIDGGNSHFSDTIRRAARLEAQGIAFLGLGVSGGEQGALWGPALMPGGTVAAWQALQPMLEAIAARAADGQPCVAYMGSGGAGHYVKMIHNGIEYADMQLIAETYDFLHRGLGLSVTAIADIFDDWNRGALKSYLVEITAKILRRIDPETGRPLVEYILDEAAQKGTGKWASQNAFDLGVPTPTINAAVESRILSSLKTERLAASLRWADSPAASSADLAGMIHAAGQALLASKIVSYAQGFALLRQASSEYHFGLDLAAVARTWRAGCIIRADLLETIHAAFLAEPTLPNLLMSDLLSQQLSACQPGWRNTLQTAISLGIPVLAMGSALAYLDAYRSAVLPANLTQAQRDYFGAHTYHRLDREGVFHTDWTLSERE